MSKAGLTAKQARFVAEYLIDLNATQAAIRAGYSAKTAPAQASRLLTNVNVAQAVAAAQQKRSIRTEITQDRVLQELSRIAFFDIRRLYTESGALKQPHELDDDAAAVLAGIDVVEMAGGLGVEGGNVGHVPMYTKKAKIPDKVGALGLAMRHLGMLTDKVQHSGPNEGPIIIAKPWERIAAKVAERK